jgi:2-polyprenyl-3-methyl-5-hydroxy-6-metoxy-1,4-benzoquinol methylase
MSEEVAVSYGWKAAGVPHSCSYLVPPVLKLLKELGVKRVLDVGSGNGVLCSEMHSSGFDPVGVEYDIAGVEEARMAYPEIPFYNFGVQDNPRHLLLEEARFEAVVSTEVIEHLYSPHLLLTYASGCLKPGGYLIITTPYHGYLKNLLLSIFDKWDFHHSPEWHGGHIKFWSRTTLTWLLENNGFRVIGFSGSGGLPFIWKSMMIVARMSEPES